MKNKRLLPILSTSALLAISLSACTTAESTTNPTAAQISDETQSSTLESEENSITSNNNSSTAKIQTFSLNKDNGSDLLLYNTLVNKSDNCMFSPYSLKDAFSLLYYGTNDTVKNEFKSVLGIDENNVEKIREYDKSAKDIDGFNVANRVYINKEMKDDLNVDVLNLDDQLYNEFDVRNAEAEAERINQFVSDNTNGKITDLVDKDTIKPDSAMILINALYFNQPWDFDEDTIKWKEDGKKYKGFTNSGYSIRNVKEVSDGDIDVLRLYYDDATYVKEGDIAAPKYAMTIFAPSETSNENKVDEYFSNLSKEEFENILDFDDYTGLGNYTEAEFHVPNFEFKNKFSLTDTLKDLGMKETFNAAGDGFLAIGPVSVSDVIQSTYIMTTEKGTEAAAATEIGVAAMAMVEPQEPVIKVVNANDDFVFVISDLETNDILFMGRVNQPSEEV